MPTVINTTERPSIGEFNPASVDEADLQYVFEHLANLYTDPYTAVIRELSVNALDSHIAAGNTAPIKITLPTIEHPYLIIQDFGVGMSFEELSNAAPKYGHSTKRGTSDEKQGIVGKLGIGMKSPFAISSSYSITAVKNGKRNTAIMTINTDGMTGWSYQGEIATAEPNGVTVSIPVSPESHLVHEHSLQFSQWHAYAWNTLTWFDPNTFEITQGLPIGHWTEYMSDLTSTQTLKTISKEKYEVAKQHNYAGEDTGIFLPPGQNEANRFISSQFDKLTDNSFVKMGPIAYKIQNSVPSVVEKGQVLEFPVGTIPVGRSREFIEINNNSMNLIKNSVRAQQELFLRDILDKIENIKTPAEFYELDKTEPELRNYKGIIAKKLDAYRWQINKRGIGSSSRIVVFEHLRPTWAPYGIHGSYNHLEENIQIINAFEYTHSMSIVGRNLLGDHHIRDAAVLLQMDPQDITNANRTVIRKWIKHSGRRVMAIKNIDDLNVLGDISHVEILTLQDMRDNTPKKPRPVKKKARLQYTVIKAASSTGGNKNRLYGNEEVDTLDIRDQVAAGKILIVMTPSKLMQDTVYRRLLNHDEFIVVDPGSDNAQSVTRILGGTYVPHKDIETLIAQTVLNRYSEEERGYLFDTMKLHGEVDAYFTIHNLRDILSYVKEKSTSEEEELLIHRYTMVDSILRTNRYDLHSTAIKQMPQYKNWVLTSEGNEFKDILILCVALSRVQTSDDYRVYKNAVLPLIKSTAKKIIRKQNAQAKKE